MLHIQNSDGSRETVGESRKLFVCSLNRDTIFSCCTEGHKLGGWPFQRASGTCKAHKYMAQVAREPRPDLPCGFFPSERREQ